MKIGNKIIVGGALASLAVGFLMDMRKFKKKQAARHEKLLAEFRTATPDRIAKERKRRTIIERATRKRGRWAKG